MLDQKYSTGAACTPQGTCGKVWRHLWLSHLGWELLLASVDRGQAAAEHSEVRRAVPTPESEQPECPTGNAEDPVLDFTEFPPMGGCTYKIKWNMI